MSYRICELKAGESSVMWSHDCDGWDEAVEIAQDRANEITPPDPGNRELFPDGRPYWCDADAWHMHPEVPDFERGDCDTTDAWDPERGTVHVVTVE
ncbi:hypothetical protein [Thioalkalivibrio sp. ALE19]|uniref:hypothetical protein n=1 Tax=Thioalkalivibrio sp. ALE19 TaxID=1266909 RepID=UPI0004154639|nr:hypothetical protein [Thioalkalivibrio sp. ALE19]